MKSINQHIKNINRIQSELSEQFDREKKQEDELGAPLSALTRASEAETVEEEIWTVKDESFALGDTGDYGAQASISNGKIKLYNYQDDVEMSELEAIAKSLNASAHISALQKEVDALREAKRWIPVSVEPSPDKYYQIAHHDDVYLDFFKWRLLDLSDRPTPCFVSVNDNTVMEVYEVSHYREINIDTPDWTGLTP